MTSNKRALYLVPKTLDAPARVLGLPLDEFIPALIFAIFFFLIGKPIGSIAISAVTVILVKVMKKGQGSSWLINLCHWYLPKRVMVQLLRKTPPAQHREYIA